MKKELFFLAGVIAVSYFSKVGSSNETDVNNNWLSMQIRTVEREFADYLGIKRYRSMDYLKLKNLLEEIGVIKNFQPRTFNIRNIIICYCCQQLINNLQKSRISIKTMSKVICYLYSYYAWTVRDYCEELAKMYKPTFEYILKYSSILSPQYACSVILQNDDCYYSDPSLTWLIDIPGGDPNLQSRLLKPSKDQSTPLKILHLTDVHISHDYEVGEASHCEYPMCCMKGVGNTKPEKVSGQWGDYNCDIPPWLFANTLNFINNTHKDIDLIYFTGDIVDHGSWKATKEMNVRDITYTFRKLAESFPNISVLPAIGNHESFPLNSFGPPNINLEESSPDWLYELNADLWSKWLPQEAVATVRRQGYYSILAKPKLRVIVLNNNICYKLNWWLLYDTNFLKEQLEFLKYKLREAEINGEYVHILAHIFPGDKECLEPWEVNYNLLVTRFAHIIKGQFFGHMHTDSIKVFYSKTDGKPNNVAYNGASLTTFTKYNPNYKIISVDPNTFDVLDIETYYFNLTEANKYPHRTPRWQRLYSMKEAYSFNKLSPKNFDWLAKQLSQDDELFDTYWRYHVKLGDTLLREGCNTYCRKELISSITKTVSLTSQ